MISIIVPVYNREEVVIRTLDSIKNQMFNDWECLVVDDRSSDNSLKVIERYAEKDLRFKCLSNNRKKGAQGARNTGVIAAKGEYVVFFDSDDKMHPDFLGKVYQKIIAEDADICGSFLTLLDENEKNIGAITHKGYGYIHKDIVKGKTYFCNDSTLIKRQKLLDISLLDEDCPAYQEYETHIRLSKISKYTTVEEELVDYYKGGADTISVNKIRAVMGNLYILCKHKKKFAFCFPRVLLKRTFSVYDMIMAIGREGKDVNSLIKQYNMSIPLLFRIGVKCVYAIKKHKDGLL